MKGFFKLEDALRVMKRDTRHFAKRQMTWFCRDQEILWFKPSDVDDIRDRIDKFMRK
jgi:tRNA dimethylallyltransferase